MPVRLRRPDCRTTAAALAGGGGRRPRAPKTACEIVSRLSRHADTRRRAGPRPPATCRCIRARALRL
eukprot:5107322-Prymnesium_polylepis.1